jgi:serine/threonine protein kinase
MERRTDKAGIPEELRQRYSNFRVLGSGAMGAVFRAHDANLDKDVALKVLKQRQIEPEVAIRFQQEAKLASKLKHHNLVTLMDFGISEKGEPYIIMESVEGLSLAAILEKQGALSLPAAVNILVQICEGMEHAHRSGVVHRDLKPSNVIVSGDDLVSATIKVLDFGIAKLDDTTGGGVTRTGTILGTPYYMSPEQFSGENVDRRADIYAAGSMLFRMLTDCHPFEGDTIMEIMQDKRSTPAPLMTEVATDIDIPEHVEDVVAKCLETDPAMRYQSMTEFKEALYAAMEKSHVPIPLTQQEAGLAPPDASTALRKTPKYVFALAGVLLIAVLAIAYVSFNELNKQDSPSKGLKSSKKAGYKTPVETGVYNYPTKEISLNEDVWTLKRSEGSCQASGAITDDDIERLVKQERGDVKKLFLGSYEDPNSRQEHITKVGWAAVGKLDLTELNISYAIVSDDDMKPIAKLPRLKILELSRTDLHDKGLSYFKDNKTIEELTLKNLPITAVGVEYIVSMKKIKKLNLNGTTVTDQSLKLIGEKMPQLKTLDLTDCAVTDDGMRYIAHMPKVEILYLGQTKVGKAGFEALKPLPVRELNVENNKQFDDACLAVVAEQWPHLRLLNMGDTKVTPKGLPVIKKLKGLEYLGANAIAITDKDMEPILQSKSIISLHLISTYVTDKTLANLAKMPKLKSLEVHQCEGVTPEGIRLLRLRKVRVDAVEQEGKAQANEVMSDLLDSAADHQEF